MLRLNKKLWAFAALSAIGLTAQAHTPYLVPNLVHASNRRPVISLEVSATHNFFIPDGAFVDSTFSVTRPNGSVYTIPESDIHKLIVRVTVEHQIKVAEGEDPAGTYRVVSGPRVGAPSRTWEVNGEVKRIRPNEEVPEGAVLKSHTQSISTMETYVTVGTARVAEGQPPRPKPDTKALEATGKGLEIVTVNHPNELVVGDSFAFRVQFEGKPLANHKFNVVYSNMDLSGESSTESLTTDANGAVSYALKKAGVYMAMLRYSEDAPLSATTPSKVYSHSLTFNVTNP